MGKCLTREKLGSVGWGSVVMRGFTEWLNVNAGVVSLLREPALQDHLLV